MKKPVLENPQEQFKKEEELSEYMGKYKIVSSHELRKVLEERGLSEVRTYSSGFPFLNTKIGGFQEGELITITGYSGHGKTSLCQSLTANFAKDNVPTLWFSYEVSPAQFFKKFDEPLPLFFLPQELEPYDLQWFKERVIEGIVKHDIRIVFIDHLHFLLNLFQSKNSSLDIGSLLRELKTFCLKYGVVIFLVAHTKQPKATEEPDMGSLRDSSFIVQESDKVLAVHRVRSIQSRSKVIILKDRDHGESMGDSVDFFLDEKSKLLQETPMERQGSIIDEAKRSRKIGEALLNEEDIKAAESLK